MASNYSRNHLYILKELKKVLLKSYDIQMVVRCNIETKLIAQCIYSIMSIGNKWGVIFVFGLHILFLASVFDIYFRSPVISSGEQGMFHPSPEIEIVPLQKKLSRHHAPNYTAPAKRLVLFVADGLRAESLYGHPERAPFLKKVADSLGSWGISHTKLPTESRPGHVALIAGMFEDPSAITKGWQENPVNFDTVFNQSNHVWSWGSPDILPMFAKGAWNGQVHVDMYDSAQENFFADQDISELDSWVFNKVKQFFKKQVGNEDLRRSDKVILFLHLLGLDTNGHSNKPNSKEFIRNLKIVNNGVEEIVQLCEKFWHHDGRTSYIFTADHGMTDWGSHGAGMDHETQTPILVWGAGLRQPHNGNSTWPLFSSKRSSDINQTDVAPLMASLIGSNFPQHSVGKLPLDYLNMHPIHKIEAKLGNALQIHEQYLSFKSQRMDTTFPNLIPRNDPFRLDLISHLDRLKILISKTKYDQALKLVDELYDQSYEGLFHYQRYHRLPLYIANSFSYIGFICYTILTISMDYTNIFISGPVRKKYHSILLGGGLIFSTFATIGQNVPLHFFLYYVCPFIIWSLVIKHLCAIKTITTNQEKEVKNMFLMMIWAFLSITALIKTFFDRRWLTMALLMEIVLSFQKQRSRKSMVVWSGLCIILMAFSFQPSVGKISQPALVFMASVVTSIVTMLMSIPFQMASSKRLRIQILYVFTSGICVVFSNIEFLRIFSWIIFTTAFPLALTSQNGLLKRLLSLTIAIQSIYQLFSLTYEALFLIFLALTLAYWLFMEYEQQASNLVSLHQVKVHLSPKQRNVLTSDDLRRALSFLTFTIVSFFGTGNISSLNSFDPRSIQTLVTTFSPFLMGGLLLLKVILPFFLVALFAFCVQYISQMPQKALFLIVLVFSDIMGLVFFFQVTDEGSWLDIGTSLSHFVIVEGTVIFLQIMFHLAKFAMTMHLHFLRDDDDQVNAKNDRENIFIVKHD